MYNHNQKLVISGMGLLLFAIVIAVVSESMNAYAVGGIGLFFVIGGCFVSEEEEKKETEESL